MRRWKILLPQAARSLLSGINLGRWGRDFEGLSREGVPELVRSILEQTALPRLRLEFD